MTSCVDPDGTGMVLMLPDLPPLAPQDPPGHPRFTQLRLRKRLRHYGYRGARLEAELQRIVAGPPPGTRRQGDRVYPYGWRKHQMTRVMKRIFCGFSRSRSVFFDEFWMHWDEPTLVRMTDDGTAWLRRWREGGSIALLAASPDVDEKTP